MKRAENEYINPEDLAIISPSSSSTQAKKPTH